MIGVPYKRAEPLPLVRLLLPLCVSTWLAGACSLLAATPATPAPASTPAPRPPDAVDQLAAKLKASRTVVYKKVGDRELKLHIFEPAGFKPTDRRPAYVVIHGGGWVNGNAKRMYPFAAHFAQLGMVGFSIEYRLVRPESGTTPFECVKDGRSAIRYIRAHAAELGIDPQKIIVSGGSAGGHVAAATAQFDGIDEAGEDLSVSSVPQALVLLFPVIDTSKEGYGNAKCGPEWEKISPLHRVKPGVPPTLIFHGTADTVTPFKGATAFRDAMAKAGNPCELVVHQGGLHGYLMRTQELYDETEKKTDDFLQSLNLLPVKNP